MQKPLKVSTGNKSSTYSFLYAKKETKGREKHLNSVTLEVIWAAGLNLGNLMNINNLTFKLNLLFLSIYQS